MLFEEFETMTEIPSQKVFSFARWLALSRLKESNRAYATMNFSDSARGPTNSFPSGESLVKLSTANSFFLDRLVGFPSI